MSSQVDRYLPYAYFRFWTIIQVIYYSLTASSTLSQIKQRIEGQLWRTVFRISNKIQAKSTDGAGSIKAYFTSKLEESI